MSGVRTNSEKKIDNEYFKLKIGTTKKDDPRVIYIEGRTFISPNEFQEDYTDAVSKIKHHFSRSISENLRESGLFERGFILDFQIAASAIKQGKKSALSFQFLLKQNKDNVLKLSELKEVANGMIENITEGLVSTIDDYDFSIYKTRS